MSDRGAEFRNWPMKRINHVFKVNRIATTPYNPRSHRLVENHNSTLKDKLYHYVESRQKNWDIFLPTGQLMYNTIVNAATAYTPYYLMFRRECNIPAMGDMLRRMEETIGLDEGMGIGLNGTRRCISSGRVLWCQLWKGTTQRARDNATRGNWTGRARSIQFKKYAVGKQFYRKRNRVRVFKSVRDQKVHKINLKLQARYSGSYKIVEKVIAVVYVADIDGVRRRVYAVNMKLVARVNTKQPERRLPCG